MQKKTQKRTQKKMQKNGYCTSGFLSLRLRASRTSGTFGVWAHWASCHLSFRPTSLWALWAPWALASLVFRPLKKTSGLLGFSHHWSSGLLDCGLLGLQVQGVCNSREFTSTGRLQAQGILKHRVSSSPGHPPSKACNQAQGIPKPRALSSQGRPHA